VSAVNLSLAAEAAVDSLSPQFSIRAGTLAAIGWGVFGGISAAVAVAALGVNERWYDLTELGWYREWFGWYFRTAIWPVIGCTTFLACAGWAAYFPRPAHSMATTVIIVTFASLGVWIALNAAEVTPRRLRSIEHPVMYVSEFFVLVVPPALASAFLTLWRCNRASGLTRHS
jgi:hypothetical protein